MDKKGSFNSILSIGSTIYELIILTIVCAFVIGVLLLYINPNYDRSMLVSKSIIDRVHYCVEYSLLDKDLSERCFIGNRLYNIKINYEGQNYYLNLMQSNLGLSKGSNKLVVVDINGNVSFVGVEYYV